MSSIPDDVRRFVLTRIPSVPYLEAALLFHQAPDVERTLQEVAGALYMPQGATRDLLATLCDDGILAISEPGAQPRYRYSPSEEAIAVSFDRLAQTYSADLVGVTKLIHDRTQKSAQRFADAFKLRKDR